jgi:hypothetical protein
MVKVRIKQRASYEITVNQNQLDLLAQLTGKTCAVDDRLLVPSISDEETYGLWNGLAEHATPRDTSKYIVRVESNQ